MTIRGQEDRSWRKSFDSFAVLGPWFVTADEIPEPNALNFWLTVNGEPRQASNTRSLIFDVDRTRGICIERLSAVPRRCHHDGYTRRRRPCRAGR